MKKFFVVFVAVTAVQSTTLSGMKYIKKIFTGEKRSPIVVTKKASSYHENPLVYKNDVLGTFELLDHPDVPVSPQELLFIAEKNKQNKNPLLTTILELLDHPDIPVSLEELLFIAEKNKQNKKPLLTTILEDVKKPKKRKQRKRKLIFQISGLLLPGTTKNLDDFERIYCPKSKK